MVRVDPDTLAPTVLVFQYNPHTVSRSLEIATSTSRAEVGQLTGQPVETLQFELVLDATDAREQGSGNATVATALEALVGFVTPAVADLTAQIEAASRGAFEVLPAAAPITLLVLGADRVLPVTVTELSITEEAHDADLTPTLARVSLSARVLTLADLPPSHAAHALALANATAREARGATATTTSVAGALGSDAALL